MHNNRKNCFISLHAIRGNVLATNLLRSRRNGMAGPHGDLKPLKVAWIP
jgi:hypothetical protein